MDSERFIDHQSSEKDFTICFSRRGCCIVRVPRTTTWRNKTDFTVPVPTIFYVYRNHVRFSSIVLLLPPDLYRLLQAWRPVSTTTARRGGTPKAARIRARASRSCTLRKGPSNSREGEGKEEIRATTTRWYDWSAVRHGQSKHWSSMLLIMKRWSLKVTKIRDDLFP